eukprot:gene5317-6622_t
MKSQIFNFTLLITLSILVNSINGKDCVPYTSYGYTSNFTVSSHNTYFDFLNTYASIFQNGWMTTDVQSRTAYLQYDLLINGKEFKQQVWGFYSSNTMYILTNGQCVEQPLNFMIPSVFPDFQNLEFIGTSLLGAFDVNLFSLKANPQIPTTYTLVYDNENCVPVSIIFKNQDPNNQGYGITEFFNYQNSYNAAFFNLPSECTQNQIKLSTPSSKINIPMKL